MKRLAYAIANEYDQPRTEKMKNPVNKRKTGPDLATKFDFTSGVRGKYAGRYAQGRNVVVLEPDVAKIFSNADEVNRSLRGLAGIFLTRKNKA